MLAAPDAADLDDGPRMRKAAAERMCAVTRQVRPTQERGIRGRLAPEHERESTCRDTLGHQLGQAGLVERDRPGAQCLDAACVDAVRKSTERLGYPSREIVSGAGVTWA